MTPEERKAFWHKYDNLKLPRTPRGEMLRQIIAEAGPTVHHAHLDVVPDYDVLNLTDEDVRFLDSLKVGA